MGYSQYWNQIHQKRDELNSLFTSYWTLYSNMGTWQFWLVASLLVLPVVLLFFTVDRKRVFEIFFFGYTVHMIWSYIDIALERNSYFIHTYFLTPVLPFGLDMTASAIPVGFLLLYQYCTNAKKNFYLYTLLVSAGFAFGISSIEAALGLVIFRQGMNQFYLYLIDVGAGFISYWLTKWIFNYSKRQPAVKETADRERIFRSREKAK